MNITVYYGKDRKQDAITGSDYHRHIDAVAIRAFMYRSQIKAIWRTGRATLFTAMLIFVIPLCTDETASGKFAGFVFAAAIFVFLECARYGVSRKNFILAAFKLPDMHARRKAWELELARLQAPDNYISRPSA